MMNDAMAWRDRGACRGVDPRLFFPTENTVAINEAKKYCKSCEVKRECLEYSLLNGEYGIWGGTTERQRRNMRIPVTTFGKVEVRV